MDLTLKNVVFTSQTLKEIVLLDFGISKIVRSN